MRAALQTATATEKALSASDSQVKDLKAQLVIAEAAEAHAAHLAFKISSLEAETAIVSGPTDFRKPKRLTLSSLSKPLHRMPRTVFRRHQRLPVGNHELACPQDQRQMTQRRSFAGFSISSKSSRRKTPISKRSISPS